jgi:hypothetical protein
MATYAQNFASRFNNQLFSVLYDLIFSPRPGSTSNYWPNTIHSHSNVAMTTTTAIHAPHYITGNNMTIISIFTPVGVLFSVQILTVQILTVQILTGHPRMSDA